MSDSDDFETQDFQYQFGPTEEIKLLNVKKFLQNPKQLMQKILFTSFKIDPFFPVQFLHMPESIKPDTAHKDMNNMNLIQQSAFRHQKLKKDLQCVLTNGPCGKISSKKMLPTMWQFYQSKVPVYEKYKPNQKSKCLATFLLDSKSILKQELKKNSGVFNHSQSKNQDHMVTHRNRIQFSSNFQCGNLFRVYQTQYNQFDLILQNDINTKGNNQWFFFLVKNVPKGLTLKFNIVNLSKKHSLFDYGMKPYVFSMVRYEKRKVGWVRQGIKVHYQQNDKFVRQTNQRPYYKLSFEHKFNFEGDIVYFSHSIPYRVSELTSFIYSHLKQQKNYHLIKFKDLNRTLGNQELDVIHITDQSSREEKKVVWVIARQHPGQVTSSFMMQGVINYLLSHNSKALSLLKKYVFKIVPMINVDGVIHGNSRAELNGFDPNRKWTNPHKVRNPIIWALKKCIQKDKGRVQMFLDLHSHSRKLGTFFYGNSFRQNKISTRKYPWMVCKNDERFTYSQCRFSQCNINSARHALFQALRIPLIYTVQSSFYGYQKNDHRIIEYLPKDYRQMGEILIQTFWQYALQTETTNIKGNIKDFNQQMIQQINVNEADEKQSIGSDSDPGEDQFQQKQLKKLLPNFYGSKKEKQTKIFKKKKKQSSKKVEKEQNSPSSVIKPKKNDKQSHYRIYFSGRNSCMQKRAVKDKILIQTKQMAIQASIPDAGILKGSTNISVSTLLEKRSSLCIWGQKVQQQVIIFGNTIALQVDMMKVFAQNKQQGRKSLPRKSFKLSSRPSSILQVKENNFLNRADCHTVPLRSLSKR